MDSELASPLLELITATNGPDAAANEQYMQEVVDYETTLRPLLANLDVMAGDFMVASPAASPLALGLFGPRKVTLIDDELSARLELAREQREDGVVFSCGEFGALFHPDCICVVDAFPVFPLPLLGPDGKTLSGAMGPGEMYRRHGLTGPTVRVDLVPIVDHSEAWDKGQPREAQQKAARYSGIIMRCGFRLVVACGKPQREALKAAAHAVQGGTVAECGLQLGLPYAHYGVRYTAPVSSTTTVVAGIGHPTALLSTSQVQEEVAAAHAVSYDAVAGVAAGLSGEGGTMVLSMVTATRKLFRFEGNWKWGGDDYIQVLSRIHREEEATGLAVDISVLPGPAQVRTSVHSWTP